MRDLGFMSGDLKNKIWLWLRKNSNYTNVYLNELHDISEANVSFHTFCEGKAQFKV